MPDSTIKAADPLDLALPQADWREYCSAWRTAWQNSAANPLLLLWQRTVANQRARASMPLRWLRPAVLVPLGLLLAGAATYVNLKLVPASARINMGLDWSQFPSSHPRYSVAMVAESLVFCVAYALLPLALLWLIMRCFALALFALELLGPDRQASGYTSVDHLLAGTRLTPQEIVVAALRFMLQRLAMPMLALHGGLALACWLIYWLSATGYSFIHLARKALLQCFLPLAGVLTLSSLLAAATLLLFCICLGRLPRPGNLPWIGALLLAGQPAHLFALQWLNEQLLLFDSSWYIRRMDQSLAPVWVLGTGLTFGAAMLLSCLQRSAWLRAASIVAHPFYGLAGYGAMRLLVSIIKISIEYYLPGCDLWDDQMVVDHGMSAFEVLNLVKPTELALLSNSMGWNQWLGWSRTSQSEMLSILRLNLILLPSAVALFMVTAHHACSAVTIRLRPGR
jgi:hypothetical protein